MSCHLFRESFLISRTKVLLFFIIVLVICKFFDVTCIFYKITAIPCPTCNMTRALLFLLQGNIPKYMEFNAMALPVAIVFLGQLFRESWKKYQRTLDRCTIGILILNLIYYFTRML